NQRETIAAALRKIDQNKWGFILVTDDSQKVLGVVTDGDVRRAILVDSNLERSIADVMNRDFRFAYQETPREQILKLLDQKVHFIPILGSDHKFLEVVSREDFPLREERKITARAKSPVRISFGGGGTD